MMLIYVFIQKASAGKIKKPSLNPTPRPQNSWKKKKSINDASRFGGVLPTD